MSKPLRVALVVLGLAAAAYGAASLTGGGMGDPPWWERVEELRFPSAEEAARNREAAERGEEILLLGYITIPRVVPRPGREWISAGVVVAGLALAALAAWPRRRPSAPPPRR